MSDYHIYIKLPSYLRQWFVHRHSGTEPVRLLNGSIESKLLKLALVKPPSTLLPHRQQADEVAVCIPYSKSRDPRTYNHITETGKRALLENIKNAFDVDCWTFLHDFGRIGKQQKDLIYLFMEQPPLNHNIVVSYRYLYEIAFYPNHATLVVAVTSGARPICYLITA